jgi:hypothetical protein
MAHINTTKGGRRLYGKAQAKGDGKVSRRREDRDAAHDAIVDIVNGNDLDGLDLFDLIDDLTARAALPGAATKYPNPL